MASTTVVKIMESARDCLLSDGYANLSTRKVAERAGVPLSQIHYHFGSKRGMVLALLAMQDQRLVERQRLMYGTDKPLWQRYEQACDFLEDDLASGYVRVLQEMIAAGWSDNEVAGHIVAMLSGWIGILEQVTREAEAKFGSLGPFTAAEIATLIGLSFLGGEAMILLRDPAWADRARAGLRRVGDLLRQLESQPVTQLESQPVTQLESQPESQPEKPARNPARTPAR